MTDKPENTKNILILIDTSWGEIDWILPVCQYIKNSYPHISQTVLFSHLDSEAILKGNTFLKNLLSQSIDNWYETKDLLTPIQQIIFKIFMKIYQKTIRSRVTPYQENRIYEYFFKIFPPNQSLINKIKPDILLKDETEDKGVRKKIISLTRKIESREIMYPHATCIYNIPVSKKTDPSKKLTRIAHDVLLNTKEMTQFFSKGNQIYTNTTHVVGIPRYDEWWIDYILKYWKQYSSKNLYSPEKTIFLLFTVRPTASSFTKETLGEAFHEIAQTVFSLPDSFLIIKPHPRQDLRHLRSLLKKYDKNKWTIDQSQAMSLSSISDIVIYMGRGSAVLDALAVGKPTILYKDSNLKNLVDDYYSIGFSPRADNPDELKNWINRFKSNPEKERQIFVDNFNKYLSKTKDGATRKTVAIILGLKQ